MRDRTQIEPHLIKYFPSMEGRTSDEWHAFLNAKTGLSLPLGAENTVAFDEWRKALAAQGYPVWEHSAHDEAAFKAMGEDLLRRAREWEVNPPTPTKVAAGKPK